MTGDALRGSSRCRRRGNTPTGHVDAKPVPATATVAPFPSVDEDEVTAGALSAVRGTKRTRCITSDDPAVAGCTAQVARETWRVHVDSPTRDTLPVRDTRRRPSVIWRKVLQP